MEKKEAVRVLVTAPLGVGGISNMMINIQSHLDRSKINFDYLVFHDRKEPQEDAVIAMGSRKLIASVDNISVPLLRRLVRINVIRKVCKENNIKILHYNADSPLDMTNIIGAKLGGVKYITVHSHNSAFLYCHGLKKFIGNIFKIFMPYLCDNFFGCSHLAAKSMFPKKIIEKKQYSVLMNGIDLKKYDYNETLRKTARDELCLKNEFVVGHAGRFTKVKNQSFLIDIFSEIKKIHANSKLILFGVGEDTAKIKEKVNSLCMNDSVIFYGATNEMYKMWQAIDMFIMPSFNEGLPVTGIEAQVSGLPCLFSDTITEEVGIIKNVKFMSLKASAREWAECALLYKDIPRKSQYMVLKKAGYDIKDVSDKVMKLYCSMGK